jgi:hypothetical protein
VLVLASGVGEPKTGTPGEKLWSSSARGADGDEPKPLLLQFHHGNRDLYAGGKHLANALLGSGLAGGVNVWLGCWLLLPKTKLGAVLSPGVSVGPSIKVAQFPQHSALPATVRQQRGSKTQRSSVERTRMGLHLFELRSFACCLGCANNQFAKSA